MATHADLAAQLLRDAADLFRTIGEQNPDMKAELNDNAIVYEQVADLVEDDPEGDIVIAPDLVTDNCPCQ
ncbi:MAG TPA: hypothetical protein PK358_14185 [Spirochaetota bacterium]|nr:hypothetical protein [Spirochaetota bacterium]HPJ35983.1 hypothetical protein [Spirochaetota bacterium]